MGGRGSDSSIGTRSNAEALRALDALPNFGNKDRGTKQYTSKLNPLMDNGTAAGRIEADRINFSISGDQRNGGTVRNVDINNVATTQPYVNTSAIRNAINNPSSHSYSSDLPAGVMVGGKVYLVDGNHRAVTAWARGQRKLRVRIINQ